MDLTLLMEATEEVVRDEEAGKLTLPPCIRIRSLME
jgi:hypothetical protein